MATDENTPQSLLMLGFHGGSGGFFQADSSLALAIISAMRECSTPARASDPIGWTEKKLKIRPMPPRKDSRPSTDDLFDVLENAVQLIEAVIGNNQLAAATR